MILNLIVSNDGEMLAPNFKWFSGQEVSHSVFLGDGLGPVCIFAEDRLCSTTGLRLESQICFAFRSYSSGLTRFFMIQEIARGNYLGVLCSRRNARIPVPKKAAVLYEEVRHGELSEGQDVKSRAFTLRCKACDSSNRLRMPGRSSGPVQLETTYPLRKVP